jgi:hypothetical protein
MLETFLLKVLTFEELIELWNESYMFQVMQLRGSKLYHPTQDVLIGVN